jgi:hypothetical protein
VTIAGPRNLDAVVRWTTAFLFTPLSPLGRGVKNEGLFRNVLVQLRRLASGVLGTFGPCILPVETCSCADLCPLCHARFHRQPRRARTSVFRFVHSSRRPPTTQPSFYTLARKTTRKVLTRRLACYPRPKSALLEPLRPLWPWITPGRPIHLRFPAPLHRPLIDVLWKRPLRKTVRETGGIPRGLAESLERLVADAAHDQETRIGVVEEDGAEVQADHEPGAPNAIGVASL